MHSSVKMNTPIEFINITPINPLISKCQIKVCYVGDEPNRNRSIITKDVAKQLANSIPGSPIVGYYNQETQDFEQHNRIIKLDNGKLIFEDGTRPYGFVDLGAKVWFQKFLDDGVNEHEYLMTEGYLWTGQYPECKRIMDKGNNHSMELDKNLIDAFWTKDSKGKPEFFIINEAIMSKLCILGEAYEPCFEGGGIADKYVEFTLEDSFKEELFSMMEQMKEILIEGGTPVFSKYAVEIGDSLWTSLYEKVDTTQYSLHGVYEEEDQKFAVLQNLSDEKFYRVNFSMSEEEFSMSEELTDITETYNCEAQFSLEDIEAFYAKKKKDEEKEEKKEEDKEEKPAEGEKKPAEDGEKKPAEGEEEEDEDEKKKKKKDKYNLEEVVEYIELQNSYAELEKKYNELVSDHEAMTTNYTALVQFKNEVERKEKEEMIKSFYMLSDDDKKEVIENIDTYSLDDIEAKLSVICVRNKVSFDLDTDNKSGSEGEDAPPVVYNLGNDGIDDATPAWVKAIQSVANKK